MSAHRFSITTRKNRVRLGVQALEGRDVPTVVLDLSFHGAAATANGAILRQADPVPGNDGEFHTFVRLKSDGVEQGYNTGAHDHQFDEQGDSALKLENVPTVTVNGAMYREFFLNINQKHNHPLLSLDEFRLFVGNNKDLSGYDSSQHTLGGHSAVFDLDQAGDVSVKLNANLNAGHGKGDGMVLVPDALFGGKKYVFLYSKFGVLFGANGGSEDWGVHRPAHAPQTFSLAGNVFADMNGDGIREPNGTVANPTPEPGIAGVTVQLQFTNNLGQTTTLTTTTDGNGNYTFAGLQAGTYTITIIDPSGFMPGVHSSYTVPLGIGVVGTGYDFGELPSGNLG